MVRVPDRTLGILQRDGVAVSYLPSCFAGRIAQTVTTP